MLFEIKKALEGLKHPGIKTNLFMLARNALPYYVPGCNMAYSPLTIYWSINSVCNLRCKMCDVGTGQDSAFSSNLRIDRNGHEIDINVFKKVVKEVSGSKPYMSFVSTEPLLYSHLEEALFFCAANDLKTSVTTNGYLLEEKAEMLVKAEVDRVNVSIDGPPEVHNEIRGRRDSFQRAIEGIRKILANSSKTGSKTEVFVNFTISNLNFDCLISFYESIKHLEVKGINFCHLWFVDKAMVSEQSDFTKNGLGTTVCCVNDYVDPSKVDVNVLNDQVEILKKRKGVNFLPLLQGGGLATYYHDTGSYMNNSGKCMASWFFAQILADGSVIPFTRCSVPSLGSIYDSTFYSVWNGKRMKKWRKFIRKEKRMPSCRRCDLIF